MCLYTREVLLASQLVLTRPLSVNDESLASHVCRASSRRIATYACMCSKTKLQLDQVTAHDCAYTKMNCDKLYNRMELLKVKLGEEGRLFFTEAVSFSDST